MASHHLYLMEDNLVIYTSSKKIGDLCKELGGKFLLQVSGDKLRYTSIEEYWEHGNNGYHLVEGEKTPWIFMSGKEARNMLITLSLIQKTDKSDLPLLINIADTLIKSKSIKVQYQKEYINTALARRLKE